jgi:hypothetical protein
MKNLITALTIVLTTINAARGQIPTNGLVASYPFNNSAGDASGNGNDGTVFGATWTTDRFGQPNSACSFNGTTDYILTPANNFLDTYHSGTISYWFQTPAPDAMGQLVSYSTDEENNSLYSFANDQSNVIAIYKFEAPHNPVIRSPTVLKAYEWYHVAVVADGITQVKIYLNGSLETTTFDPNTTSANGSEWFADISWVSDYDHFLSIGALRRGGSPEGFFEGKIDDIRIYSRALTDAEILALYSESGWSNTTPSIAHSFFDDFHYRDPLDQRLKSQFWLPVGYSGKPPCSSSKYDPSLISFVPNTDLPGDTIMVLRTYVDPANKIVRNSRMETSYSGGESFFEGTYAARVKFSSSIDANVQTFFTFHHDASANNHSECDFEYLPKDQWGGWSSPALYMTSWAPDGSNSTKQDTFFNGEPEGWHTLFFYIHNGVVDFTQDDAPEIYSNSVYPTHYMNLSFANWIDSQMTDDDCSGNYADYGIGYLDPSLTPRMDSMMVDWVYHAANVSLSKAQVLANVEKCRKAGEPVNHLSPSLLCQVQASIVGPGTIVFSNSTGNTGVKVNFTSINGQGSVTASSYGNYSVHNLFSGIPPAFVSSFRWVIDETGLQALAAKVIFALTDIANLFPNAMYVSASTNGAFASSSRCTVAGQVVSPNRITVYRRSTDSDSSFVAVPTTYDPVNNEITADVNSFGEFIFGSDTTITNVSVHDGTLPQEVSLSQNYPNPFNPSTTIRYGLPQKSQVTLKVFNTLGQLVTTLVNGEQEAGYHEVRFDGSNLASGVYFYRLQAGDFVQTKRLLLLK